MSKTPEELAAEFKADQAKALDAVREIADKAVAEAAKGIDMTKSVKELADQALSKLGALTTQLGDIEQKMARRTNGSADELKTLGQMVVDSDQVKAMLNGNLKRGDKAHVSVDMKTISNLTTGTTLLGSTVSSTTSLVMPDRQAMVNLPDRRLTVRDLITPGQTSSNAIEYPVETSFQNSAAVVAEGIKKAQSDVAFDLRSTPVRTIAHFMKASRQIMDDAPMLQTYIDGRLRYGLGFVEEAELLYGDGTGQHLFGIIPQASTYAAPFVFGAGETAIDRLRLAILQATLALYPATGIVLHPTDWAKIETLKDAQGRYIVGDPQGSIVKRLWSLPVARQHGHERRHVPDGRLPPRRAALRSHVDRSADLHRERRRLREKHDHDPRRRAPRARRVSPGRLRHRQLCPNPTRP
jgi:HK97 family phage major capsid protein